VELLIRARGGRFQPSPMLRSEEPHMGHAAKMCRSPEETAYDRGITWLDAQT
jgi:hypothetical protein